MDDNLVSIGKVVGTYGVHGWVKVFPLTDYPERFKLLKRVTLQGPGARKLLEVEACQPYRQGYLFKFKGIDSPKQPKCSASLAANHEDEVYPLPAGVYYHFQLQGLEVYDERLGYLGKVSEILQTGANDVYVVDSPRFGEVLLPAIKEIILRVDLEKGRIEVNLLPGLIDEERTR